MDNSWIAALSRALGGKTSRRRSVRALTGLGLAGAATVDAQRRGAAQDATPVASPATDESAPEDATFLFVQVAESGTWEPKADEEGLFTLTLSHANGQTVYFSDRPERIVGTAPTDQFLDGLGFSPANPPNAAVVTGQDVVVVELTEPVYDAGTGTLAYDARLLPAEAAGDGLAFLSEQQTEQAFPATFGNASLFIDDCPDVSECQRLDAGPNVPYNVGPIPPGINTGQCWHWDCFCCKPCNGWSQQDYDNACNAYYSECDDLCYIDIG